MTFLLIHGAWHGAWCWDRQIEVLKSRGEKAIAITLPGHRLGDRPGWSTSLTAYANAVNAAAAKIDGEIHLVGHSMGGMLIMLMQGNHSPFKALGLFGSSAGGLDWGLSEDEKKYINDEDNFARDLESLSLAKFGTPFTRAGAGPSGESITFGGETDDLTKRLREISCEMNSASAMMSMMRGSFKSEVDAIEVPLLFAFGDHDIGIPPEDAPKDFINAPSAELVVLEKTGHNHFAFSSMITLCETFDYWASNLD